jgi:diguanylate cyclase (GGDEF)-like protein
MAGASFILAINLFIAALFALAFFLVGISNRADKAAPCFALAYVSGMAYIASEFIIPLDDYPQLAYTAGFAFFLGAVTAVTYGVARRYGLPLNPLAMIGLVVVAIIANWFGFLLPHDSVPRNLLYQAPYALLQALAAWVIVASRRRQPIDIGLIALFSLSAVQFLSKPFAAILLGGSGDTARAYIATTYALYSQSLGAMLQVATGLLMLTLLVRDMLVEVTARSETDPLSSVLNRRGFEERSAPALQYPSLPAALILADLDAFKAVNDSYGHDTGDQVIMAFARLMRDNAPPKAVVGRLGGEEFAMLLPDANIAAARLLAETLRVSFSALQIPGLPAYARCSASFGVAERMVSESLSDLRRRADAALYTAKRAGRDRVIVAAMPDADAMPLHPATGTSLAKSA